MQPYGAIAIRVLLLALILLSGYLYWLRFGVVVQRIRTAKRDEDYKLGSVQKGIWTFVWEVLFQGKVIKERPLPGLAHAFVFWGFCAFALVTLNHLASGFGIPFLHREHFFGAFYFWF